MDNDKILYQNRLYFAKVASTEAEKQAAYRLRYRVFHHELGELPEQPGGLDQDRYDEYCDHLIVVHKESGDIVATERLLPWFKREDKVGYYSEQEFELTKFPEEGLAECGRLCVDKRYRDSVSFITLWLGLDRYCQRHKVQYLFGCTSLKKDTSEELMRDIFKYMQLKGHTSKRYDAKAKKPMSSFTAGKKLSEKEFYKVTSKMVHNYIRIGSDFVGDPCYDPEFQVYDMMTLSKMNTPKIKFALKMMYFKNQWGAWKKSQRQFKEPTSHSI